MTNRRFPLSGKLSAAPGRSGPAAAKKVAILAMALALAACSSQAAREAEIAAEEAARVAADQEAARVAQEQERQRALEERRRREAAAAEERRLAAARAEQEAAERARQEEQRRRREEAERREQERLAAIAAVEEERREKLARIAELEQQLAASQSATSGDNTSNAALREAVEVAEELLNVLTEEQDKYENTDDQGNTVEPLAKELIAELEARRNELLQRADSQ